MIFTIDDIKMKFRLTRKSMKMGPPVYEFLPLKGGTGYVLNTEAVESEEVAWNMVTRHENLRAKRKELSGISGHQTSRVRP